MNTGRCIEKKEEKKTNSKLNTRISLTNTHVRSNTMRWLTAEKEKKKD